jgi:MFS family permease
VAICLGTFIVLADFMAVGVALPTVQRGLNASFGQIQWVMEAFLVPLTAGVLAAGYVAGRAGRRRVFVTGLSVFACASLLAGLAPSIYVLIGSRVAQGIGGAMLVGTGAVTLAEVFREAHGRVAVTVWGTVTGLAVALSPLIGSLIDTYLGWRWIFILAAVAATVALVLGMAAMREPAISAPARAPARAPAARAAAARAPARDVRDGTGSDWKGLMLFTAGIAILVIGLVRTTTTLGGWAQSGVLACFACSGLLLIAFVAVEGVSPNPLLDVSLFRRRTLAGSAIAAFGLSMAVLGPFIFLVLYLSYNLGYSTLSIGGHLFLLSGMTIVLLPLAGWLDRLVPVRLIICGGLALVGTGLWLMSRLPSSANWGDLVPGLIIAGVGLELVNPRLAYTAAAAAAVDKPRSAVAAARANSTLRHLGTATGVAVLGSVFATRLTDEISSRLSGLSRLNGLGPQIAGLVLEGRFGAALGSAPATVRPALLLAIHASFTNATHEIFLIAAGVALGSAVLALSVRSSDVPRREASTGEVEIVPAAATPAAAENGRAQLTLGRLGPAGPRPGEPRPGEPRPAEVAHAGLVRIEVRPGEPGVLEVAPPDVLSPEVFAPLPLASQNVPGHEGPGRFNGAARSSTGSGPGEAATGDGLAAREVTETEVTETEVTGTRECDEDESTGGRGPKGALALITGDAGAAPEEPGLGLLAVKVTRAKDGSPLKAELTLVNSETEVIERHWTGAAGEFTVPAGRGDYELVVQSLGYRPETVPVEVADGGTRVIELALVGLAHIYGAVAGPRGGWLPGVLLTLTDRSGRVVATTKSDAGGSYHFVGVPEGSYTVAAPACTSATSRVETGPGLAVAADVVFWSSREGDTTVRDRPLSAGEKLGSRKEKEATDATAPGTGRTGYGHMEYGHAGHGPTRYRPQR